MATSELIVDITATLVSRISELYGDNSEPVDGKRPLEGIMVMEKEY